MKLLSKQVMIYQWSVVLTMFMCCYLSTTVMGQSPDTLFTPTRFTNYAELAQNLPLHYPHTFIKNRVERNHSIMFKTESKEQYYPIFCRLEDKINEGNKIKCLFRLGSVSYVNYLEQKGDHQRLMLEQLR